MACSNCFNGCSEITSDKCVKYTGPTIESLGITNGDTLNSVENNITTYLLTALDGTGIVPEIDPLSLCALVSGYLPLVGDITLVHIVDAIFKSLCDLQTQVTANTDEIAAINSVYTEGCLTVVDNTNTHQVLQAAINQICTNVTDIAAIEADLLANYVAISDIDTYIETYLLSAGSNLIKDKMVPYSVVAYYGPTTNFDASGAGTGDWVDVYLCNGNNGTPDLRGRTVVGSINGMVGGTLDSQVDPITITNPNYSLGTKAGANAVTLNATQIPSHTHTGTTDTIGSIHTHILSETVPTVTNNGIPYTEGDVFTNIDNISAYRVQYTDAGGAHTHTFTTGATGGGQSHSNIQPSIAAYYIIYIP